MLEIEDILHLSTCFKKLLNYRYHN